MKTNWQTTRREVDAAHAQHQKELVAASKKLKAMSNLEMNKDLQLTAAQQRTGFVGLLKGAIRTSTFGSLLQLWFTPLTMTSDIAPALWLGRRGKLQNSKVLNTYLNVDALSGLDTSIVLTRKADHYLATFCVGSVYGGTFADHTARLYKSVVPEDKEFSEEQFSRWSDLAVQGKTWSVDPKTALQSLVDPAAAKIMASCLESVKVVTDDFVRAYVTFKITRAEAQHMANREWNTIRPIDIYPLLQEWQFQLFGALQVTPSQGLAISVIAKTLPKDPEVLRIKVNDKGLTCDPRGKPVWIPIECDNTKRYEDEFSASGVAGSSVFTLRPTPDAPMPRLPRNIMVLTDWVNSKFSYTNTHGRVEIRNLANCRKATAVHIDTWLAQPVTDKQLKTIISLVQAAVGTLKITIREGDLELPHYQEKLSDITDVAEYLFELHELGAFAQDPLTWADFAWNADRPYMRPVGRWFRDAYPHVMSNLEVAFQMYSVLHVTTWLPYIILAAEYAPKAGTIRTQSNEMTSKARDSVADDGFELDPLPLWNEDLGFQPHQRRISGQLSTIPENAILPVPAGGGKTPLIVADVLANIAQRKNAPYLIMCPSHLVAQYAKEINFFTKGRLNVIPIKTRIVNVQGLARLTDIIEKAPINTVVVVDYDTVKLRGSTICYGTTAVNVFPVAELLQQFSFQYVALDESHFLKNPTSARTRSIMGLIADIPVKRLASGTLAHDSPSDLAAQIGFMDPTLFGTRDDFNTAYGSEVSGDRVISWKPGYAQAIDRRLKSRVVVAGAKRKEWAALLPEVEEFIEPVVLTPAQRTVYESILQQTVELIQQDATLMRAMESGQEAEGDVVENGANIEALLKPYISRLEQFVSAPDKDVLGDELLQGQDRVSPKIGPLVDFCRTHIEEDRPGKILIFTNHTAVAEHIFENLPPDLKKYALHYVAAEQIEAGDRFERDPRAKIMVGVEVSMNTGLNLQHASCILRVETVWNPGTLEQGQSRVFRPSLKVKDTRTHVWYRWYVAASTIDVTKISRLTSKIVTVAKYENPDDPAYQELPDLPIIKLDLESIQQDNSWSGTLMEYASAYRDYRRLVVQEYREYKEEFIAKYGDNFMYYPGTAEAPADAALIADAPYAEGLEILGQNEMKLVRVDQFLREDASEFDDEEGADEAATEDANDAWATSVKARLVGQEVHTQYGDGIITRVALGVKILTIRIGNNEFTRIRFSQAFLKTLPLPGTVKQGQSLMANLPLTEPSRVIPARAWKPVKMTKAMLQRQERLRQQKERKAREKKADLQATVNFITVNGFVGLRAAEDQNSQEVIDILLAQGFRPDLPVVRARMKSWSMLDKQMRLWATKKFAAQPDLLDSGVIQALLDMGELLKTRQLDKDRLVWKLATKSELRNFYRMEIKPSAEPKLLKVYPLIENGMAYLALPVRGQVGTRNAIKVKAPGVIWQKSPETVSWFCQTPIQAKAMLEKLRRMGIAYSNVEELKAQYPQFRKQKARKDSPTDIDWRDDD